MKNKIFILLAMLIAMPILFADPVINEVEIELMEVAGFLPGAYIVSILQDENKYVKSFIKQ